MQKLVVGSDDKRAMVKTITTAFPEATHTLCTRQILQDDAVDKQEKNKMLDMIFGAEGIINADKKNVRHLRNFAVELQLSL